MKSITLRHLFALTTIILLSACSSLLTELSASSEETVISDYKTWVDPNTAQGSEVRLGGVIASVINLKDKTRIEVVNVPIDSVGRPSVKVEPQGRFVGYVNEFLDPVTFAEGRLVTLLGNTAERESGKVGDFEHQYPVMTVKGYHLWRVEERIIMQDSGPYLSHHCLSYFCRDRDDMYREGRVIQEVK
ncbi:MAG: Slp family lipoprotein [Vibrio sp.]|uniref:Slp family lipoprotein n=1 Tax=Vibrio sp. TaxID=678 RepID=UPI003A859C6F